MLFITTRNILEAVRPICVLKHDRSSDGGFYVPLKLPTVSPQMLETMVTQSFGQSIADILNLFFSTQLDGWDVDFCIGRQSVRVQSLGQKVCIAECWHNPHRNFASMVKNLSSQIRGSKDDLQPTYWAWISVRIAVLFAVYAQLRSQGVLCQGQTLDVSVPTEDFTLPMTCWYAKQMGLPIGNVLCACQDSSKLWDFYRNGTLSFTPEKNVKDVLSGLEPLIYASFGREEVNRYLEKLSHRSVYNLQDSKRKEISNGFRACVISSSRIHSVIHNVQATSDYLLDTECALAFAAIQDNRTAEGESKVTLLLSQHPQ